MSEIYLIRHAQASFGAQNYDRLSQIGVHQAEVLASFVEHHGLHFDAIYTGSMERQKNTAKPLYARLSPDHPQNGAPIVMSAFNEYDHQALIKAQIRSARSSPQLLAKIKTDLRKDKKAFQAYFSDTVHQWMAGTFDADPGVEPWPAFCQRVQGGLRQIMATQGSRKRLAVFTSGGVISAMVQDALGLSDIKTAEISWQIFNASLTCLKYTVERVSLTEFNNATHLLLEGDPKLLTHR